MADPRVEAVRAELTTPWRRELAEGRGVDLALVEALLSAYDELTPPFPQDEAVAAFRRELVTASRPDRQPPTSATQAKGGQGMDGPDA